MKNRIFSSQISSRLSLITVGVILLGIISYITFKVTEINNFEEQGIASSEAVIAEKPSLDVLEKNPIFTTIDPIYLNTDVASLIEIHTVNDVDMKRKQLNQFIWGDDDIPTQRFPSKIDRDFRDERYALLYETVLSRIDRMIVAMDFGLLSHIYHFIPKEQKHATLVLLHEGHEGDFIINMELIGALLEQGYSVAGFCMPLVALNAQYPTGFIPRIGFLTIISHEHMKFLSPDKGHHIKYFFEPVIAFINYAEKEIHPKNIMMTGLSGGAWTTTLCAAIDKRITVSIPVAGSYPIFLRSRSQRDWGDYEQTIPELYRICNYPELYLLGASGKGRKQLQIINKYDPCCFAGVKWQTYHPIVKNRSNSLGDGGEWDLFMDDSHANHAISPVAKNKIISILKTM